MPTGLASPALLSLSTPVSAVSGHAAQSTPVRVCLALSRLGGALLLLALSLLLAPHALANPTVPQGGSGGFSKTGTDLPVTGVSWDIVRAGSPIATSSAPNGWSVYYNTTSTQFSVAAPASAAIATGYEVRSTGASSPPTGLLNMPRPLTRRYSRLCAPQAAPGPPGGGGPGAGGASAFFDVVAGGPVQLNSLSVSPTLVLGGAQSTGTVTLSGGAPAGGAVVTLSSSNATASVPASVTVAQGQSSATFTISTQSVTSSTSVMISAVYSGTTQTATLTVVPPPTLTTLSLVPAGVTGGSTATGTVILSGVTPTNITVSLGNTNSAASVPASVTVYQGQSQGSFSISTAAVTSQTAGTITATLSGVSLSQPFTVYPPQMLEAPRGFVISPNPVVGGQNTTAIVTLDGPAPTGGLTVSLGTSNIQFVALGNSDPAVAIQMLPQNITIPAGQSSVSVLLATAWADYTQSATVTAKLGQQSQDVTLTLLGANLRLTDVLGPTILRLHWDGITTQGQGKFLLTRDGATLATLPAGTATYDDVFPGGFATGQSYLYQLYDTSVARTSTSQLSSEKVAPYLILSTANQAVDSRLDLRYSDNHYLDHCFGTTSYRGGLFAGMASDPSKVGRSFARVSIPVPAQSNSFFRTGGLTAYCTGLQATSATTVSIGCQIIPENTWDFSKLVWTATSPDSFSASAATATTAISYDPANPVAQWVNWAMPDVIRGALATATTNNAPTPLTMALAAANENQQGWAYFAKSGFGSGLAPGAAYALAQPVPVAAYVISYSATVWYYNIIMNGLNPGDRAAVILSDGQGHSWPVAIDGLHHVVQCYSGGTDGYIPVYTLATCNGVSVPIQKVQAGGGGGTQPGGGGGTPVFGGGAAPGGG